MSQLIFVYGADNVGKSTYCKTLAKQYQNAKVIHFGPPKAPGSIEHYIDSIYSAKQIADILICDRGTMEAPFYDWLYRNFEWTKAEYQTLANFHQSLKSDFDTIEHRLLLKIWGPEMIARHQQEIDKANGGSQSAYNMAERQRQHELFYNYMHQFSYDRVIDC